VQVSYRGSDHPRYASNTLKKEVAHQPFPLCHGRWPKPAPDFREPERPGSLLGFFAGMTVTGGSIHPKPQQPHHAQGHPVGPFFCLSMGDFDIIHLYFGVYGVVPCWRCVADILRLSGWWKILFLWSADWRCIGKVTSWGGSWTPYHGAA